ncbi:MULTISPECIES: hypothetical protein [Actinomadura]|uniref:Uncharacterized protein n=1 Tax=Actinomadura miaoliensis TaxID=430685 RepID=A0ABP7WTV3_9ACTN
MTRSQDRPNMVLLTVNGRDMGLIHRSVLDRVAEIADRLGCRGAMALGGPPASFAGADVARLRRDLDQVIAFADAARRTGWTLGDIAVAPGEQPEPVLDTPQGRLWAHPVRGFELHGADGVRRVTELAEPRGTARRTPLARLITPLAEAAARAQVLEVHQREHRALNT